MRTPAKITFAFLTLSFFGISAHSALQLPSKDSRVKLFDEYVRTIERVDGEGLIPRKNRPESWKTTIHKLRRKVAEIETEFEFGHILKLVDATYPSLHAKLDLAKEFDIDKTEGKVLPGVAIKAEDVHEGTRYPKYRISHVVADLAKRIPEKDRPMVGDEVLMINSHSVTWWSRVNFIYCKFPQREQCEVEFYNNFRKELLPWDRSQTLRLKIRREQRVWGVDIPIQIIKPQSAENSSSSSVTLTAPTDRYPGFKLSYTGDRVWAFESPEKHPGVVVLSIPTFHNDPSAQSELFFEKFWKIKASKTKFLIIDLIDNGGGNSPMPWYTLFLDEPFHEMFVRFKKFAEFDQEDFQKALMYDHEGQLKWLKYFKERGTYSSVRAGQFLPQIPQFCGIDEKNCSKKTDPRKHGFTGKITVLLNQYCISSCSGFAWQLKTKLGSRARFAGFPDSGDSNYGRVFVNLYPNHVDVTPRKSGQRPEVLAGAIAQQMVTATMSTDEQGYAISGQPVKVESLVSEKYHRTDNTWETATFLEALKDYDEQIKKEAKKK